MNKILSVLVLLAVLCLAFAPAWSNPYVAKTACTEAVFVWDDYPQVDYQVQPVGFAVIDGVTYDMTRNADNSLTVTYPFDSQQIDKAIIFTKDDGDGWLGVVSEPYAIDCTPIVYLPLIRHTE